MINRIRRFLAIFGSLVLCIADVGCETTAPVGKNDAIVIAKNELRRQGWNYLEVTEVELKDGSWEVTIWRTPNEAGGYATVIVSESEGKVVDVRHGK